MWLGVAFANIAVTGTAIRVVVQVATLTKVPGLLKQFLKVLTPTEAVRVNFSGLGTKIKFGQKCPHPKTFSGNSRVEARNIFA